MYTDDPNTKIDIKSLTKPQLEEALIALGEKKFRATQIYQWMHQKLATSYEEMTNLPATLKEKLSTQFSYTTLRLVRRQHSAQDGTQKFLFALPDDCLVESVFMPYKHGNSVCISSQVGCRMGCRFCASTLDGLTRNLLPAEMLEQIYAITRITREKVSNVVVMGTGEPLDNYDHLVTFIHMLTDPNGLNISQRNVTVSTCGLVPEIKRLAGEKLQITLALSLHGATDEKRQALMPIAKRYHLNELMEAMDFYFGKTGRRITFEYSLVAGVNDTPQDVADLTHLAAPRNCHINLIPVNPIKERDYQKPSQAYVQAFKNKLEKNRINVTIRREMGQDIDGACGQLRKRHLEEQ